jgi:hypothetical protein
VVGNGFPGLAIVSLIALLGALGLATLLSLQPWAANAVAPQLSVAPGLGIGLGDAVAVAVAPGRQLAVAPARLAIDGVPKLATDEVAAGEGESGLQLGIDPARAVAAPQPVRPPAGSPEPTAPEPLPAPQSPPAPVAVPVAAPAPAPAPSPSPEPVVSAPARNASGFVSHPPGQGTSGGPVVGEPDEVVEVHEGDEHAFAFSFYIQPTVYRPVGADNLVMQFTGEAGGRPSFGLQLWDDGSGNQRGGLWASGDAMGGERFLAPVAEGAWHEAIVYFQASSEDDGFYLLTLDGQAIDARAWISLIDSESGSARIEVGLFRDGERVVAPPDISFGPTRLGDTL